LGGDAVFFIPVPSFFLTQTHNLKGGDDSAAGELKKSYAMMGISFECISFQLKPCNLGSLGT